MNVRVGLESWLLKNWCFELWYWRRLLRVPWTAGRSNQSILKEISPEYSLEGLMLKLKLRYFGHLMWRADSLEKTLMLGKTEGRRRRGQQMPYEMVGWHHWFHGQEFESTPGVGVRQGGLVCCNPWGRKKLDTTERLNWTELKYLTNGNRFHLSGGLFGLRCLPWNERNCMQMAFSASSQPPFSELYSYLVLQASHTAGRVKKRMLWLLNFPVHLHRGFLWHPLGWSV